MLVTLSSLLCTHSNLSLVVDFTYQDEFSSVANKIGIWWTSFAPGFYNNQQLFDLNAMRMYLQVTMLPNVVDGMEEGNIL